LVIAANTMGCLQHENCDKAFEIIQERSDLFQVSDSSQNPRICLASSTDGPTRSINFPGNAAGGIIAPKGASIAELRQKGGATVKEFNKESDRCGTTHDRELPWTRITEDLEVPGSAAGVIIGIRGAKITEIRERSGAKVHVDKEAARCMVNIIGNPEQVRRARAMIQQLVDESASGSGNQRNQAIYVPISMIGHIIGKDGETLRHLQAKSAAKIQINAKDQKDPCRVNIGGSCEAVSHARRLIFEIIDRESSPQGSNRIGHCDEMERNFSHSWRASHSPTRSKTSFGGS
jgi:rRNA processing protein Krr1/Pno1